MDPTLSSPPSNSPSSKASAYTLSALFLTVSASFILVSFSEFRDKSFSGWATALQTSPWGVTIIADYILGAMFAAVFIWVRDGAPLFCIPSKVMAVLCPFVGSPLVLLYMAVMVVRAKSVAQAFLPRGNAGGRRGVFHEPGNKRGSVGVVILFAGLLVMFAGVIWRAFAMQRLEDGWRDLRTVGYHYMTFWDNLIGLLLPFVVVVMRGWGNWAEVAGWVVGLVLSGNGASCVYMIVLGRRSLRENRLFADLLLSEEKGRE